MSVESILIASENHNSPLETVLRTMNVNLCADFLQDGGVRGIKFKTSGASLPHSEGKSANILPKTSAKNGNAILESDGVLPKMSGERVAVLFSGGPAAGGHNVVAGIKRVLGESNTLFGVKAGPKGLITGDLFEIGESDAARILNSGGFDFLGSDRTKIKSDEQFDHVRATVKKFGLTGIIVVGGDDSNTNAAFLAEELLGDGCKVIGVPKTIDGDLQLGEFLPITFGFDTASKIYAELVGNILQDTPSSRKYWHFVKLMGRSASHIALEVALQTKPTVTLISEEIAEKHMTLDDIVAQLAKVIVERSKKGLNYGVVLVPEGLIEFVPELRKLISELNDLIAKFPNETHLTPKLTEPSRSLMNSMPEWIQTQLLADRDSHGNLQVSQIPTEELLIEMTQKKIQAMNERSEKKTPFVTISHFFGYEGRCGAPTIFDASYCFNLGLIAGSLILNGKTGYMASLGRLDRGGKPLAIPLGAMLSSEKRDGKTSLVIKKALVETTSRSFQFFASRRDIWAQGDVFSSPGPRQFWGETANQLPISVALNQGYAGLAFDLGASVNVGAKKDLTFRS